MRACARLAAQRAKELEEGNLPQVRLADPAAGNLTAGPSTDKGTGYVVATERTQGDSQTLWAATRRGRVFVSKNAAFSFCSAPFCAVLPPTRTAASNSTALGCASRLNRMPIGGDSLLKKADLRHSAARTLSAHAH